MSLLRTIKWLPLWLRVKVKAHTIDHKVCHPQIPLPSGPWASSVFFKHTSPPACRTLPCLFPESRMFFSLTATWLIFLPSYFSPNGIFSVWLFLRSASKNPTCSVRPACFLCLLICFVSSTLSPMPVCAQQNICFIKSTGWYIFNEWMHK